MVLYSRQTAIKKKSKKNNIRLIEKELFNFSSEHTIK